MPTFVFSEHAKRKLRKFDVQAQHRIFEKMAELKADDDFRSMTTVRDMPPATHRLRVGDYRLVLMQQEPSRFLVIDVDHRSRIYK